MNIKQTLIDQGYELYNSGGGCWVYNFSYDDGTFIWLSTENMDTAEDMQINDDYLIGLYDKDGECLKLWESTNIGDALHIAQWIVPEWIAENVEVLS